MNMGADQRPNGPKVPKPRQNVSTGICILKLMFPKKNMFGSPLTSYRIDYIQSKKSLHFNLPKTRPYLSGFIISESFEGLEPVSLLYHYQRAVFEMFYLI